ncbi:MAG: hypothetical protein MZV64_30875 [Ignavibacteriales bacterium]|nr:hypothetical protein [Ignavibacteriales bacterium]
MMSVIAHLLRIRSGLREARASRAARLILHRVAVTAGSRVSSGQRRDPTTGF